MQRLVRDRQLNLARVAFALVAHDIAATTNAEPPSLRYTDDGGCIRLAYGGCEASVPVLRLTQAEVTIEVADFVQDEVVEHFGRYGPYAIGMGEACT